MHAHTVVNYISFIINAYSNLSLFLHILHLPYHTTTFHYRNGSV